MSSLRLVRVSIEGPTAPNDTATFGEVEYARKHGGTQAIYITFAKPSYGADVSYPARNDARMKITPAPDPLSNNVVAEFCGSDIELMVASAFAQETVAGAVGQIAPLLRYFQENFSVA